MKKIIFIILIFATTHVKAQIEINNELNKFIGTWRWTSGTDTVLIVLQKQASNFLYAVGKGFELIIGWHKYVKNGILKESSLQYVGLNCNVENNSLDANIKNTLRATTRPSPTTLWFYSFWDLTLHKFCEAYLTLLPGSTAQATWKLTNSQGLYNGPPGTNGKFTLPKTLILTKQ